MGDVPLNPIEPPLDAGVSQVDTFIPDVEMFLLSTRSKNSTTPPISY